MGVSHRRLSGWEPAELSSFEYDDAGRLLRVVTVREPEFTPDELALLLMSRRLQRDMGRHGIPMAEATDPANQFAFAGYEAPLTDFAEKALEDAKDRYYKAWPNAERNGHLWGVTRRDG